MKLYSDNGLCCVYWRGICSNTRPAHVKKPNDKLARTSRPVGVQLTHGEAKRCYRWKPKNDGEVIHQSIIMLLKNLNVQHKGRRTTLQKQTYKHKVDRVITNLMLVKWLNWKAIYLSFVQNPEEANDLTLWIGEWESSYKVDSRDQTRCTLIVRSQLIIVKLGGFWTDASSNWVQLKWTHNFLIDR
jgi:hypothetical protein